MQQRATGTRKSRRGTSKYGSPCGGTAGEGAQRQTRSKLRGIRPIEINIVNYPQADTSRFPKKHGGSMSKKSFVITGALLLALGAATIAFRNLALWLVVSDAPPASLDAVFTFAGETQRIVYSRELFAKYKSSRWILSYPSKRIAVRLAKEKLDTSRIVVVDTCKNTSSEALFVTGWAGRECARFTFERPLCVGLVSTPFHMRRIQMEISRKFKQGACRFYYLPVPYERYGVTRETYRSWWLYKPLRQAVLLELQKYVYYFWT